MHETLLLTQSQSIFVYVQVIMVSLSYLWMSQRRAWDKGSGKRE